MKLSVLSLCSQLGVLLFEGVGHSEHENVSVTVPLKKSVVLHGQLFAPGGCTVKGWSLGRCILQYITMGTPKPFYTDSS